MSNIIMGGKVNCPLCGKAFKEVRTGTAVDQKFYVCPHCCVSINALDPALDKWDMLPKEECPLCHKPMAIFYRALDGYMQYRCKPCGTISAVGKDEYLPKDGQGVGRGE